MAKDNVVVDLTNYKDRVGARVKPGRYLVLVEDAEQDKSKAGNTMINLWLQIKGGDFDGATLVDRLTITDKAMFRVVGFMQAIGLPTPKKRLNLNLRQFIGKTLEIDVEDGEPYNGRVKSEVRGYMRAEKSAKDDSDDLDDLSEDVSDEPTDYDEDEEPEKAEKAEKKRKQPVKDDDDDDDDAEDVDLDEVNLG